MVHNVIRLALHGCANRPFFRLVVMPSNKLRDSQPIEQLGTFDPVPNKYGEKLVALNFDRIKYWLAKGARTTDSAEFLFSLSGFYPINPVLAIQAGKKRTERESKSLATDSNNREQSNEKS